MNRQYQPWLSTERPSHLDIDTPWKPQPIVWRYGRTMHTRFGRMIENIAHQKQLQHELATTSLTHIVREVRMSIDDKQIAPGRHAYGTVRQHIETAYKQYDVLRDGGVAVADTELHAFDDQLGFTRLLARVAIIEAAHTTRVADMLPKIEALCDHVTQSSNGDLKLFDIHMHQFVFGTPRAHPESDAQLTYVDIEPRMRY